MKPDNDEEMKVNAKIEQWQETRKMAIAVKINLKAQLNKREKMIIMVTNIKNQGKEMWNRARS